MGEIKPTLPIKLFIAITYNDIAVYSQVRKILQKKYGQIDQACNYDFSAFTRFYRKEMGDALHKTIVSFQPLIEKDETYWLKHYSNNLELEFANQIDDSKKRNVNIDPGYLTEAKIILLTTKNYAHRIYIGQGIFAEITLTYRKDSFTTNSWTYPDYKSEQVIHYFNDVRNLFREQLKKIDFLC